MAADIRPIDDDYKRALGGLVFEFSRLDSGITTAISAVTGMDILHAIILVHHQQFSNKWDALFALLRHEYEEAASEFQPVHSLMTR